MQLSSLLAVLKPNSSLGLLIDLPCRRTFVMASGMAVSSDLFGLRCFHLPKPSTSHKLS